MWDPRKYVEDKLTDALVRKDPHAVMTELVYYSFSCVYPRSLRRAVRDMLRTGQPRGDAEKILIDYKLAASRRQAKALNFVSQYGPLNPAGCAKVGRPRLGHPDPVGVTSPRHGSVGLEDQGGHDPSLSDLRKSRPRGAAGVLRGLAGALSSRFRRRDVPRDSSVRSTHPQEFGHQADD